MPNKSFPDPIAPTKRVAPKADVPKPWPFRAPTKEEATTGRFMEAGDDYGVGFRSPVGKEKAGSMESGPIPQRSKCFPSDQAV
jgi:hypothetical protein